MLEEKDRECYAAMSSAIAGKTYDFIHESLKQAVYMTDAHLAEVTGSYLEHRGKALRPVLLALSANAAGLAPEKVLPACAAVEMFHTWTLMHDDVIDHDDFRRGRPTAHRRGAALGVSALSLNEAAAAEYGLDLAILGGDMLHSLSAEMLMRQEGKPEVVLGLARRMCFKLAPELLSGEQMDVRLSQTAWTDVTEAAIMEMMRLKTGALLAFCAECGTALGEGRAVEDSPLAQALGNFAHGCGLAFQMKDDLLGIFGEEASFGKPIGSDIREGKRTVLMLRALSLASDSQKGRLLSVLGRSDATREEVDEVRNIISDLGADRIVEEISERNVDGAMSVLKQALPDSQQRRMLEAWAGKMLNRVV